MCKTKNLLLAFILLFFGLQVDSHANNDQLNRDLVSKVSFGRAADVEILLKQGADPNIANPAGITLLFMVAGRADDEAPKIMQALINGGADIYKTNTDGNLPIVEAVKRGHPLTVRTLVANKSLMSVTDKNGVDLMTIAQRRANNEVLAYVKAGTEAEQNKLAEMKSDDNLNKQIKKLSLLSCAEYYMAYFKKENPEKMGDEKYAELMKKNKADTDFAKTQLSSLFDMSPANINNIATQSKQRTEDKLGSLLTKENRLYNGFGTHTHLNSTCKNIADSWGSKRTVKK